VSFQDQKKSPAEDQWRARRGSGDMFPIIDYAFMFILFTPGEQPSGSSGGSGVVEHTLDLDSAEAQHWQCMFFAVLHKR